MTLFSVRQTPLNMASLWHLLQTENPKGGRYLDTDVVHGFHSATVLDSSCSSISAIAADAVTPSSDLKVGTRTLD